MEDQSLKKTPQLSWGQSLLIGVGVVVLCQWAWSGHDPRATMLTFKDDPISFKGKLVTGRMTYTGAGGRLADDVGTMQSAFLRAPFTVYTTAGVFDIQLLLPHDLQDVPQAGFTDRLHVTFKCNTGELDSGNVVTSIRRE